MITTASASHDHGQTAKTTSSLHIHIHCRSINCSPQRFNCPSYRQILLPHWKFDQTVRMQRQTIDQSSLYTNSVTFTLGSYIYLRGPLIKTCLINCKDVYCSFVTRSTQVCRIQTEWYAEMITKNIKIPNEKILCWNSNIHLHFFFATFTKGNNFYTFLFSSLDDEAFPQGHLLLKERICSKGSKLFPF